MTEMTNYMEVLVAHHLGEVLEEWQVCKCDKCKKDIAALALNHLQPMYVTSETGSVYAKASTSFNPQNRADVILAINEAIKTVSKEVRHEQ